MAVTMQECHKIALPVIPDGIPFPEHVSLDCTGLSNRQIENNAKRLRAAANARDWQFQP